LRFFALQHVFLLIDILKVIGECKAKVALEIQRRQALDHCSAFNLGDCLTFTNIQNQNNYLLSDFLFSRISGLKMTLALLNFSFCSRVLLC
jgi:hypothetical protein